jgi:flagellar basal-body rod protein FlgC
MSLFSSIGVAGSGVTVYRKWLDAISDNVANLSTVRPTDQEAFRARYVIAQSITTGDGGVQVGGTALGNAEGRLVHEPGHPLADADGNVRYPDIDLGSQMAQMIMAQRGYQANLAVVDRAKTAYEAALSVGRG